MSSPPWCGVVIGSALLLNSPLAQTADARAACVPPENTNLVEFQSGDNTLRGFIELPKGHGKHPAIMMVHWGNPTDVTVDSYYDEMRGAFRAAGIATVIWDKAGNGCSSGEYASRLPIQERASEAIDAVAMLKKRDDIDPHRIGLWALSQGDGGRANGGGQVA